MSRVIKFLIVLAFMGINSFALPMEDAKLLLELKVDSQKITKNILLISMDMDYIANKDELVRVSKALNEKIEASQNKIVKKLWQNYQKPIKLAMNDDVDILMIQKLDKANQALYKSLKKLDAKIDKAELNRENLVANQIIKSERIANSFIHLYRSYKSERSLVEIDDLLIKYDKVMLEQNQTMPDATVVWRRVKPILEQALELRDVELETIVKECDLLSDVMKKNLHFNSIKIESKVDTKENNSSDLSGFLNKVIEKNSKKAYYINTLSKQSNRVEIMTKSLLLVVLGVEEKKNRDIALANASKFSETISKLLNDKKDLKIKKELFSIKSSWYFFKNSLKLALKGDKESIVAIIEKNSNLSRLNEYALKAFQKRNFIPKESECLMVQKVNLAGKLRYLTQKMVKEKILIVGGLNSKKNEKRLANSIATFSVIMSAFYKGNSNLKIRPIEQKLAKTQLNSINSDWKKIKPLYEKQNINDKNLKKLIKKSIDFMNRIDSLVVLFVNEIDY